MITTDSWLKTFTFIFSFKLTGPTCDHLTVHTSQSTHRPVIMGQLTAAESDRCSVSSPPLTRTKSSMLQAKEELVCVETETGRVRPPLCSSSSSMWEGKVFTETV